MGRRAVRALLLLVGALVALTGCLPSVPFRLPALYEGQANGAMVKETVPELCQGVHVVLHLWPSFRIVDQGSVHPLHGGPDTVRRIVLNEGYVFYDLQISGDGGTAGRRGVQHLRPADR